MTSSCSEVSGRSRSRSPGDRDAGAVCATAVAERQQRALQAELVERLRAQPPGDHAHVLGACARRLPQLLEVAAQLLRHAARRASRCAGRRPVSTWPISSCSSRAIRRRSASCAASARRPLSRRSPSSRSSISLNASASAATSASASVTVHALTRRERIDPSHHVGQPLQRRQRPAQHHPVRQQHRPEARQDHGQLPHAVGTDTVTGARTRIATATPRTTTYATNKRRNSETRPRRGSASREEASKARADTKRSWHTVDAPTGSAWRSSPKMAISPHGGRAPASRPCR